MSKSISMRVAVALAALVLVGCGQDTSSGGGDTTGSTVTGTDAAVTSVVDTGASTLPSAGSTTPATTPATSGPNMSLPPHGTFDPTAPTFSTLPRADANEGDPGTVSVALSEPVAITGWGLAPVACSVDRRTYTASFDEAAVNATLAVSATIKVVNYTAPGTYPAVGSATVLMPGNSYQVPLAANVTIDAALNGTVVVSTTLNTTPVAFTLTWYCSA
jgi:hypothetical protein